MRFLVVGVEICCCCCCCCISMGDGCVACVPSQQIMEQFSMCGGNKTSGNSNANTTTSNNTPDVATATPATITSKFNKTVKMKPKTKIKRRKTKTSAASANKESLDGRNPHSCTSNNISVSDVHCRPVSSSAAAAAVVAAANKDEVEEGELGTMDVDNQGPFPRKLELKSEIEKGEFVPPWKWKWRKREEAEKGDLYSGSFRGSTNDRERFRRSEVVAKDEHGVPRTRTGKDRGLRGDCEETPPSSAKYSSDKDLNRSGNQHAKRPSRYECTSSHDKTHKLSSKIIHDDGSLKSELSNGKNNGREYFSGKKLKRAGVDSEISARKIGGEYDEYASSKSRKLSDGDGHSVFYTEKYSRSLMDRSFRNSSTFSNGSSDRYSSSNYKSSMSSRNFYDKRNGSPRHPERSPHDRSRYHDHREWSPARRDKSPYDRGHHWSPSRRDHSQSPYSRGRFYDPCRSPYSRGRYYDHKNQSPSYPDNSPHDGDPYHDRRDGTPNFLEQSPLDWSRNQETIRKSGTSDKQLDYQKSKGQEDKLNQTDPSGKESKNLGKESKGRSSLDNRDGPTNRIRNDQVEKGKAYEDPNVNTKESIPDNGFEDMASMEEDMDICNTPPHVPVVADASTGKWYYVDNFGVECGPSKLCELKTLVDEGYLVSDHFIKHIECERWVTVENAVSPSVHTNLPSIVPDSVTKLASPPEVPGNLLADNGDPVQSSYETSGTPCKSALSLMGNSKMLQTVEDLRIDERVGAFLEGVTVFPGKELETVGEVLQLTFEYDVLEKFGNDEGEHCQSMSMRLSSRSEDDADSGCTLLEPADKDSPVIIADTYGVFSGLWSCKGGDWRRNDDVAQDRSSRKKLVLNDGFPLCQMPKSGYEDPRWQRKEELYYPLLNRKLELPAWAFTPPDEWNDRSNESKPVGPRGGRGTILPVVRINVCVVKDHGSFVSDARMKIKGKEKYSSKGSHSFSSADDTKTSSEDGVSCFKHMHGQESHGLSKHNISIPKDHVCTATELQLHLGDWFYLDGSGHEHGPLTFMQLQALAGQGAIPKSSSVFRKVDRIWVPLSCYAEDSGTAVRVATESKTTLSNTHAVRREGSAVSSIFHDLHPQFIGYTRGKLHEFVMKSYKSREFAAAINEFLDPWINARQPKKEMESSSFFQKSGQYRAKRAKLNDSEGEFDLEDECSSVKDECSFDELCGDETFDKEYYSPSELAGESWGALDGHVLARIFHFLRADLKSLVKVSLTCKSWRSAVRFYKSICLHVDLCSVANSCNDSTICGLLNEYNKEKLRTLLIRGCFNITSGVLEEVLQLFPQLSIIDIRNCSQLDDLTSKYPRINWVSSHSKIKSLKQIDDTTSSALSICSVNAQMDDFSGLRNYLESSEKRESANQLFHRSLYKRSKLFDTRKSSTILSRDAHLRRLAMRKYDHGYKKMAEFLASSLKDIMKENSFEYFVPKVARIEGRIRNGYYAGRGLSSIKEDIRRMCRDAIKLKNRGNASDMNRIISLFIRLATSLDGGSVPWKDDSPPGFSSASSKYKKVFSKGTDKKFTNRSNRFNTNGILDFGEHASDREIRRRLSKLNRKPVDSGSETSEDFDRSSDKYSSESESTASDTESDSEARTGSGLGESNGDVYSPLDDGLDPLADDREWGARMTEASLVPPVTRKYEVIDHYVIVADEGEVKRKMQVSLPDNYADKLIAQRNGTEESDMEIPEVKDYKPRKQLGDEVIEQEVYGIDPYTHNLLLDSMPEDSDWSLLAKHAFIEDVVLRTLNKQVRHFTGSGSVPMTYSLKPVFDEIEEIAVEENDWKTIRLCQYILKAIDTRLEDKYVAYRKGLGVVCNKKGGFSEEDFVVEFLGEVYPAWKWFEKQDGIRSLQKNSNDPAPEFYNIHLERPKGDADGYDLVVVDAMHKANYASRICHSCRPNCEAKVTAVDGQYQIGIYTVRPIRDGEEVTFDYNSVTESKEEYEASVCLCGSQVCRGSYLNLTGEEAFQKVLIEYHGIINRLCLMLEACELNSVSDEDLIDLGKAGLGSCLLGGLPDWLISYSARLVRFINFERTKLPDEILKHNVEEKKKYFSDVCLEVEKCDAEVQAEGVYNQRLQNLAITLDKVRYVMKCVFGDPKKAPPPLERLRPEAVISLLWKGEGSLVDELIQCITPHVMDDSLMRDLKTSIRAHDPSGFDDSQGALQRSLIWLRDEVRNLPCTYKCRNDAAADLIHIFAHTKCFFRIREYKSVTSPPLYISPLDLGPKYADKVGSRGHEYSKTYGENYCLGQLIFWHIQTYSDPDSSLARAGRGCLCLPDIGSFYAKVQKPSRQRVYGPRTLKFMLTRMEKQPQRPWPKDRIWTFTSSPKVLGTPMVDAVLNKAPMDKEMIHWLKNRPPIFQAMWDR